MERESDALRREQQQARERLEREQAERRHREQGGRQRQRVGIFGRLFGSQPKAEGRPGGQRQQDERERGEWQRLDTEQQRQTEQLQRRHEQLREERRGLEEGRGLVGSFGQSAARETGRAVAHGPQPTRGHGGGDGGGRSRTLAAPVPYF
jgi:hypothetical protein